MISSTSTLPLSAAGELASRLKANGSEFFNQALLERKFKAISSEQNPIAAAIKLRELYKNLEISAMFIAELIRVIVPKECTEVSKEYKDTQNASQHCIKMKMELAQVGCTGFYTVAFPLQHKQNTSHEGIFQKNIVTRFVDIDNFAYKFVSLNVNREKDAIFELFKINYIKSLDDVKFIQSELLAILKSQANLNKKMDKYLEEKSRKSVAELHFIDFAEFLEDHQYSVYFQKYIVDGIVHPYSQTDDNRTFLVAAIQTLKRNEVYILKLFHEIYQSKSGQWLDVYFTKNDIKYLEIYNHVSFSQLKIQAGVISDPENKEKFLASMDIALLEKDQETFASITDLSELDYQMMRIEKTVYNILNMLSLIEEKIATNQPPEVLATPSLFALLKSIGKKKKPKLDIPASTTDSSSSTSEDDKSSEDTKTSTRDKLKYNDENIVALQKIYRSIFRNPSQYRIAMHSHKETLINLGNRITDVILPMQEKAELALAEPSPSQQNMTLAISRIETEISKLKKTLFHFVASLEAAAAIENSERVLSKAEQVQLAFDRKAQEKKKLEQQRLEEKSERPVKIPYQRPRPEVKPVPLKPKLPVSRPTEVKLHEPSLRQEICIRDLNEACKNLIYIRLLLGLANLDKEIKHYGLFYNIFRCFQSLKLYQERGGNKNSINADEIANLRNMIIHHGINAVCEESVEDFSATIVGNLPQALAGLRKNDLFRRQLDDDSRQSLIKEFGLIEKGMTPYASFFNHAKLVIDSTPLYMKLKKFHEAKTDNNFSEQDTKIIVESYIPLMKKIIASMAKVPRVERHRNINNFIDSYLFELQALRMLAIICGELISPKDSNLRDFLYYCRQSVRNVAGHALVDMESPVNFLDTLERKLNSFDATNVYQQPQRMSAFFAPPSSATQSVPQAESGMTARMFP
jgi:hypothetical protein